MRRFLGLLLCWPLLVGGGSRSFDGANDEIDFGNVNNVTTGNYTLCIWAKSTEDASTDFWIGKRANVTTATAGYSLWQLSTDTSGIGEGDGVEGLVSPAGDADGVWVYACGVWTASTEVNLNYANGAQISTATGGGSIDSLTSASALQMGEDASDGNDSNSVQAYGRFHNVVLSVMNLNETMWFPERVTDSLSGLWPLWGSNSPEVDLSGLGLTGTIVAGAAESQDGPPVMFGLGLPL